MFHCANNTMTEFYYEEIYKESSSLILSSEECEQ